MGGVPGNSRCRSRVTPFRPLDESTVGGELDFGVSAGCFESANGKCGDDNDTRASEGCMKGSTVSPMLLRLSPKDGVDECVMGRGECSMSLSGTPSTESREFNAQWLPSPFRERRDSEGCRPAKMRLALRVTPSSMDGPLFICADTRAAFRRCRSAISHRFKVSSTRRVWAAVSADEDVPSSSSWPLTVWSSPPSSLFSSSKGCFSLPLLVLELDERR